MARLKDLDGVRVALDSVIFIYALEGNPIGSISILQRSRLTPKGAATQTKPKRAMSAKVKCSHPIFGERAKKNLQNIEQGRCQGIACDLVLAELMVKPLREGQPEIAEEYARDLPTFPNLTFISITRTIVVTAARLRGNSNLGLIDALHLATAVEAGCTVFITNDAALRHPTAGLEIWMLTDIQD